MRTHLKILAFLSLASQLLAEEWVLLSNERRDLGTKLQKHLVNIAESSKVTQRKLGPDNRALWEKVVKLDLEGEVGIIILVDPDGKRFQTLKYSLATTEEEIVPEIAKAIQVHSELLSVIKKWNSNPDEALRRSIVRALAKMEPVYRDDFREIAKLVAESAAAGAAPFEGVQAEQSPIDKLHDELLNRVDKDWQADNWIEVSRKIDAFILEKKLPPVDAQKMEIHKYRIHSLRGRFDQAIAELERIKTLAPDSELSRKVPDIIVRLQKARDQKAKQIPTGE